jgi:hypothetical protein
MSENPLEDALSARSPKRDLTRPVIDALRAYQALEDADAVRVTLAVAATSGLGDEPIWLQLVGSPSSGKSEMIAMLRDVVDGRIGEVTVAGMLGWHGRGKTGRPTGLLARIGDGHRLVTITDFSTVIADSDRNRRAQLFSFLRTVYDGYAIREINTAPEPLEWEGRLTIVSAVTPQIDHFSAHADALGPRWLYCRVSELSPANRRRATQLARQHADKKAGLRAELRAHARTAVRTARDHLDVDISEIEGNRLDDAAIVATLGRADVPRDGYGKREICGEVTREEPPRMAIMLALLFRGLRGLGVPQRQCLRITTRCALDSMPNTRRKVLGVLADGETLNTSAVARRVDVDRKVVRFALEELELLGAVAGARISRAAAVAEDVDHPDAREVRTRNWRLSGEDGELVARVFQGVRRNVEEHHTSPHTYTQTDHGSSHGETGRGAAERSKQ